MATKGAARRPARGRAALAAAVVLALAAGCQAGSSAPPPEATPDRPALTDPARAATSAPAPADPRVLLAVRSYRSYLQEQAAALPVRTGPFTDAVRAGDVPGARKRFPASRVCWERIQWVAAFLPDLDRRIDARAEGFAGPADPAWTGWHRLEHTLWTRDSTTGAAPLADRLDRDLESLRQAVPRLRITPVIMATGITRLVEEALETKVPGAEDRYSGTDLADLAANLEGAEAAYGFARPVVAGRDPALARLLDREFAAVGLVVGRYRAAAGYRPYPALSPADGMLLRSRLGVLAESLSRLSAVFAR
ncbi:MAG TPA: EfeM/EfeO family lipoprotein [Mycobacteriales bacterium]